MEAYQNEEYHAPKRYTVEEYRSWSTEPRYELIDGAAYMMSLPTARHQDILGALLAEFRIWLRGKTCRAFSDLDVVFGKRTVVRPDIIVVCDQSKLTKGHGCHGVPDIVIEILSPGTERVDFIRKMTLYMDNSVGEYWIVDPKDQIVIIYTPNAPVRSYGMDDTIQTPILEGFSLEMNVLFSDIMPDETEDQIAVPPPIVGVP